MAGERRFLTAREQASLRGAESLLNGPDQAYDEWDWFKRHDEHPPVEAPAGLTWFHVSPADLEPGTVLAPFRGNPPWGDDPYQGGLGNRADWVWVEHDEDKSRAWMHWVLDHQPQVRLYRVTPRLGPYAWNGTADEGWVTDSAVVEELLAGQSREGSRRRAAGPRVIPVGFNDDQTTCALCGREELKGTVILGYESGGEYGRFGTGCASKVMSEVNGTPRRITRSDAQKLEAWRRDTVMNHLNKATKALQAGDVAQAQWEIADMRRNPNAVPHRQDELDAIAAVDATGSYRSVGRNLEPGELQAHYRHRVENGLPEYETSVAPNQ